MSQASPATTKRNEPPPLNVRAAFRELHGGRLHGFALLLTLGDGPLGARLATEALAAGADRLGELRHPERAAAWLRARVVGRLPRRHHAPAPIDERTALAPLGVEPAVVDALASLGARERAAIIASAVERFGFRDLETITARRGPRLEQLLLRARERYLTAYASTPPLARTLDDGPLVRRIHAAATRALR